MPTTREAEDWFDEGILRFGLWSHAHVRPQDLADSVTVIIPGRSMCVAIDAAAPGRRYQAALKGPAVAVLPACCRLQMVEQTPGPLVVMALDSSFVEAGLEGTALQMAGVPQTYDPYLRRAGAALLGTLRREVVPDPAYFDDFAKGLRDHLCTFYTRRRRQQSTPPLRADRLEQAIRFMSERFADKDLGVEAIAASVHLSPFHFTRLFTQAAGKAPHAYLTGLRMAEARRLLGETCIAIADIARRCGYSTHAHFTGVFGRNTGMTPAAYRIHVRTERAKARRAAA